MLQASEGLCVWKFRKSYIPEPSTCWLEAQEDKFLDITKVLTNGASHSTIPNIQLSVQNTFNRPAVNAEVQQLENDQQAFVSLCCTEYVRVRIRCP